MRSPEAQRGQTVGGQGTQRRLSPVVGPGGGPQVHTLAGTVTLSPDGQVTWGFGDLSVLSLVPFH